MNKKLTIISMAIIGVFLSSMSAFAKSTVLVVGADPSNPYDGLCYILGTSYDIQQLQNDKARLEVETFKSEMTLDGYWKKVSEVCCLCNGEEEFDLKMSQYRDQNLTQAQFDAKLSELADLKSKLAISDAQEKLPDAIKQQSGTQLSNNDYTFISVIIPTPKDPAYDTKNGAIKIIRCSAGPTPDFQNSPPPNLNTVVTAGSMDYAYVDNCAEYGIGSQSIDDIMKTLKPETGKLFLLVKKEYIDKNSNATSEYKPLYPLNVECFLRSKNYNVEPLTIKADSDPASYQEIDEVVLYNSSWPPMCNAKNHFHPGENYLVKEMESTVLIVSNK